MVRRGQNTAAVAETAAQTPVEPAAITCAFECDRAALVSALRRVKRAINSKSGLPILTLAHVEVRSESVRITGTDLVLGVTEELAATTERLGTFLLPLPLLDLLSTSDAERVAIRVDAACMVRVTLGRRSGEYASAIAEDFPALPKCPALAPVEGRVLELLAQIAHCQSQDTSRPHLNATLYEHSDGRLHLVATDGQRLGFRSIEREGQGAILLPAEFVETLSLLDESEAFELGRSGSNVFARQGATLVFGKLVDAAFPRWSHVVSDARSAVSVECDRAALVSALRGMTSIDEKYSARVAYSIADGELVVSARDSSGSRNARAAIPVVLTGKPFRGGINAQYLIAALSTSKAERVRIEAAVERDWSLMLLVLDENGGEIVMGMRP